MILTQNMSQEQHTPNSNVPILNTDGKRPGTGAIVHQHRSSIGSSIITHSNNESLKFNKDETDNLKDIFSCFDKDNTGFVKEEDLIRILNSMNKYSQNVVHRITEIKGIDKVANEENKFTFLQFMKILGKVEVDINENASVKSDYKIIQYESKIQNVKQNPGIKRIKVAKELQQSCNIEEDYLNRESNPNNLTRPRNKTVGARTKLDNLRSKGTSENDKMNFALNKEVNDKKTPRLQKNILIRRQGKQTSMEKTLKNGLSPDKILRKSTENPIQSNRMSKSGLPISATDAPMNLMQFRGVRIQPDK